MITPDQKTYMGKNLDQKPTWYHVDATDTVLGRMSSRIALLLRGKGKATFTPNVDCGDFVVVTNVEKLRLTGNKWEDKVYYRHSHHVGGLKSETAKEMRTKYPDRILFEAVRGMLPKNKLAKQMLKKLKVYSGDKHPHEAQKLKPLNLKGK